jgi:hypothetical protein
MDLILLLIGLGALCAVLVYILDEGPRQPPWY